MKKSEYIDALNNIHASDAFKERCKLQMLAAKQERATAQQPVGRHRAHRLGRRAYAALTVALSLTLFAGAGYAIYRSTFDDAKTEAEAAAETSMEERTAQYATWWDADEDPFWTVLDGKIETDAATITLKTLQWYRQEEQYGLFFGVAIKTKRDDLRPKQDGLVLTGDGVVLERRAENDGDYVDENGEHIYSFMYNYDGEFKPGIPFNVSGMFHTYDADGNITGDTEAFSLDFTFTQAQIEEKIRQEAELMAVYEAEYDQSRLDAIDSLPKNVVGVGIEKEMGILSDFAADTKNGVLGFGFRTTQGCMEPLVRVDGYAMHANCVYYSDGSALMLYRTVLARDAQMLPDISLIAIWQTYAVDTDLNNCFVFRYDWKNETVILPENEAQGYEWIQEDMQLHQALNTPAGQSFDVRVSDTKNGVTATITNITFDEYGGIRIQYTIDAMYCPLMAWEYVPEILVNGHPATCMTPGNYMVEDGFQKIEAKQLITDSYIYASTIHYAEFAPGETIDIQINWKLKDLDAAFNRFDIGTFQFKFALTRPVETQNISVFN